jgi:hypothetical protein
VNFARPHRIDAQGRRVYTSAGRRLLAALLEARDEHGRRVWTLARLSERVGASVQTLSALSLGLHRMPSLEVAIDLEDLAGVNVRSWRQP